MTKLNPQCSPPGFSLFPCTIQDRTFWQILSRPWAHLGAVLLLSGLLLSGLLTGCNGVFFQPNDDFYYAPQAFGLPHEEVWFPTEDGTRLHGWFLPSLPPARGTVIFFHGNAANISNHLAAVKWLPRRGYSVFLFDYRGYGQSPGQPSREAAIADGVSAIRYVRARTDLPVNRLVVYGQSLGGALAVNALAEAGTEGVRALLLEATFGSYRKAARRVMDGIWLTWPFQYPFAWLFFTDDNRPLEAIPKVAEVPTLFVHREGDGTVRLENGRELFAAHPGPDKTFWAVPGKGHIVTFLQRDPIWRERLIDWLDEKMVGE